MNVAPLPFSLALSQFSACTNLDAQPPLLLLQPPSLLLSLTPNLSNLPLLPPPHLKPLFFFLAIPKTCISVLRLRDTIRYGVPNQLVLYGISTLVILVSLHLLLHLVDFNCLVRSRFAERETWLDSSHWGSPCSCE